jgi:hypothetical protein
VKGKHGISKDYLAKKGVSIINRDFVVFAFFLLLSFVFWYLNSLGKEIEADIKYPIEFINLPKEKIILEESQLKLNLFLKGPGYSILKLKIAGKKPPLIIDISKVNYKRIPDSKDIDYYIVTSGLTKSLSVRLRSGCEITSIKPDTLFFTLEKFISKTSSGTPDIKAVKSKKAIFGRHGGENEK